MQNFRLSSQISGSYNFSILSNTKSALGFYLPKIVVILCFEMEKHNYKFRTSMSEVYRHCHYRQDIQKYLKRSVTNKDSYTIACIEEYNWNSRCIFEILDVKNKDVLWLTVLFICVVTTYIDGKQFK